jgi:hypothetical protein
MPRTAVADFGDGQGYDNAGTVYQGADTDFYFPHVYADDGAYTARLLAGDADGSQGITPFSITVNDVDPDVRLDGANYANKHLPFNLGLFHNDPGDDPIDYWLLDWATARPRPSPARPPPPSTPTTTSPPPPTASARSTPAPTKPTPARCGPTRTTSTRASPTTSPSSPARPPPPPICSPRRSRAARCN